MTLPAAAIEAIEGTHVASTDKKATSPINRHNNSGKPVEYYYAVVRRRGVKTQQNLLLNTTLQ